APWARERGVSIDCRGDARVDADTDSVARSIDNLLRNAVEASPAPGTVDVTVEVRNGIASLSVRDRGPGVAAEHAAELFEPFFTTKPDGTGLGLPLSRAIARSHDGDVAYYRDGDVTRLELTLPVSSDDSAPSTDSPPSAARPSSRGGVFA